MILFISIVRGQLFLFQYIKIKCTQSSLFILVYSKLLLTTLGIFDCSSCISPSRRWKLAYKLHLLLGMSTLSIVRGDLAVSLETSIARRVSFDEGRVKISMLGQNVCCSFNELMYSLKALYSLQDGHFARRVQVKDVLASHTIVEGEHKFFIEANDASVELSREYLNTLYRIYLMFVGIEWLSVDYSLEPAIFLQPITAATVFIVGTRHLSVGFSAERELLFCDLVNNRTWTFDHLLAKRVNRLNSVISDELGRGRSIVQLALKESDEDAISITLLSRPLATEDRNTFTFDSRSWQLLAGSLNLYTTLCSLFCH